MRTEKRCPPALGCPGWVAGVTELVCKAHELVRGRGGEFAPAAVGVGDRVGGVVLVHELPALAVVVAPVVAVALAWRPAESLVHRAVRGVHVAVAQLRHQPGAGQVRTDRLAGKGEDVRAHVTGLDDVVVQTTVGAGVFHHRGHELRAPQLVGGVRPVPTGRPLAEQGADDLTGQVVAGDALGRVVALLRGLDHELRHGGGVDHVVDDVLRVRRAHGQHIGAHRGLRDRHVRALDHLRPGGVDDPLDVVARQLHLRGGEADQPVGLGLDHVDGPVRTGHGFVDHRHVGGEHVRVLPLGLGVGPGTQVRQTELFQVVVDRRGGPGRATEQGEHVVDPGQLLDARLRAGNLTGTVVTVRVEHPPPERHAAGGR